MAQIELIQIDTVSMFGKNGLEYQYQVVINQQETPAISLDGLYELRKLCDRFIRFGEDHEASK